MTWRAVFAFVLVVMIAASIAMAIAAVERSPGWVTHPGAAGILRAVWLALVVYAGAIVIVVANRGAGWDVELRNAALFGTITGVLELINIALERSGISDSFPAAFSLGSMLALFVLWGMSAARTARDLRRFRPGVIAAIISAGICMVIAVTGGFATELFIAPPRPDVISTWAEFGRSGWLDAHAFGITNTLDSGFTHLWMGPVIAVFVGSLGAWLGMRVGAPHNGHNADTKG
jgi:hypothetical protein